MSGECPKMEVEIVAAGRSALTPKVAEHVERCARCAALRAEALALAEAVVDDEHISPTAAVAIARRAIERERGLRPRYWILPMLSASASVAALVLWFGLAGEPEGDTGEARRGAATQEVTPFTPRLPDVSSPQLPDSLRAVRELVLDGGERGGSR